MTIQELSNKLKTKQENRKKRVQEFHTTPEYKSMWQQVQQKTNQFTWQQIDADTEKRVANNFLYKRIKEKRQQRDQNVKQLPYEQTSIKQETKTQKHEEKEDNKNKLPMQSVAKTQSLQEARVNIGNNNALLLQQTNTTPVMYSENKDAKKIDEEEVNYQVDKIKREKEKQQNIANADGVVDKAITTVNEKLKDIAQKPKALYNKSPLIIDDVAKIAGGTLLGVGAHAIGGLYNAVNSLINTGAYGVASVAGMAGAEDFSNKLKQAISDAKTETRETEQNIYNALGEKNSILGESGNELVEQISFSKFLGALSQTSNALKGAGELRKAKAVKALADSLTFAGGADSSFEEAYSTKDIEDWQALLKGIGGGSISWLTENFNDALGYGGTKWSKAMKEKATDVVSSAIGKALLRFHITATSEAGEEVAENLLGKGFNKLLNGITDLVGHGAKFDTEVKLDELLTEATMGYVSTFIAEGGSTKINNTLMSNAQINQYEQDMGRKLTNEEKKIIREEVALQNELDIEKEEVIDESDLDDDQKIAVRRTMYKLNLNKSDVKELIKNVQDEAKRGTTIENKTVSENEQQITQEQPQIAQNETSEEIQQVEENQPKVEQKTQEKDILDTNQTYKNGRKQTYAKYAQDNSEYDNSSLENAKQIIPANKQGRRTKEQWLNVAKQIGTEIAEKSDAEIEEIAYRTWLDERPNNKSSLNRQGQKYVDFNSDEWINTIYNQVKDIRAQNNTNTEQVLNETIPQTEAVLKERAEVPTATQLPNAQETTDENILKFREETNKLLNDNGEEKETREYSHNLRAIESDFIDDESKAKIKKIIHSPDGRYEVIHNAEKIGESEDKIQKEGLDKVYEDYCEKFDDGKQMTLDDIYDCEVMIQQYSYRGDSEKVLELLTRQDVLGKELGQKIQAMSIISRGTKEGKLLYMQKCLQRYNSQYGENIEMNQELVQNLLNSNTDKEIEKAVDKIYKDIGSKMPPTIWESIDAWRYFSMLFNPSTHIRNLGGNTGMHLMQGLKNEINGAIQDVYKKFNPDFEQTVSLIRRPTKAIKEFAQEDLAHIGDIDDFGNKYAETFQSEVEKYKKKLPVGVDQTAKLNENLLNKEDKFFLEWEYKKSLARYISANNLSIENDLRVNNEDSKEDSERKRKNLDKARKWAVKEALEATFHQKSALATALNNFERKAIESDNGVVSLAGVLAKVAIDSKLPYKRTPINIGKTAMAYSPAGLLTSFGGILTDIGIKNKTIDKRYNAKFKELEVKRNNNKISEERYQTLKNSITEQMNEEKANVVNTRIDKISKGLTGTALMVIGATLANMDIIKLKGASEDDEDEYNEEMTNQQPYSITIGDINIPIDWLAPRYNTINCRCKLHAKI